MEEHKPVVITSSWKTDYIFLGNWDYLAALMIKKIIPTH